MQKISQADPQRFTLDVLGHDIRWTCTQLYTIAKHLRKTRVCFLGNTVVLFCMFMKRNFADSGLRFTCLPISGMSGGNGVLSKNFFVYMYFSRMVRERMPCALNEILFVDMTASGKSINNTAELMQAIFHSNSPIDFVNVSAVIHAR